MLAQPIIQYAMINISMFYSQILQCWVFLLLNIWTLGISGLHPFILL